MLFALCAHAQFLTNVDYNLTFGDLSENAFPGKTIVEGNYVYTVTHTEVSGEGTNILVKKHHIDGTATWEVTHSNAGTTYDYGVDIAINGSGDVFVLGARQNGTGGYYDYQLIKYDGTTGGQVWSYIYYNGGQDDVPTDLVLDASSNAYMTGIENHNSGSDVLTICVNSGGGESWASTYDYDSHPDGGFMVEVDGLNLYTFAITTGDGAQKELTKLKCDINTGNQTSVDRTNLGGDFDIKDMKKNSSGDYIACGSNVNIDGNKDVAVYSFSSSLGTNWSYSYDGGNTGDDVGLALENDGSNNCYVTGYRGVSSESNEGVLLKLNSSGVQQWISTFNRPRGFDCRGSQISLDNQVTVAGIFKRPDNTKCAFVSKYNFGGSMVNFLPIYKLEEPRSLETLDVLGTNHLYLAGTREDAGALTKFSMAIEFLKKDTVIDDEDTTKAKVAKNQLIIRFNKEALIGSAFLSRDRAFGRLDDFITPAAQTALDTIFPDSVDLDSIWVSKIFLKLTSKDTLSKTRYGDTIRMPGFWRTLLFQFNDDIDEHTMGFEIDSLDSLHLDPIEFAEPNLAIEVRWTPNDPEFDENQPCLNATSSFPNAFIHAEGAWNIERGQSFVRLGVIDRKVDWRHEDFHLSDNDESYSGSKIEGGYAYRTNSQISDDEDFEQHGTMVAGIAGAITNNNKGIAGMAGGDGANNNPGVSLYSLATYGVISDYVPAVLDAAWDDPNSSEGTALHLINNSWGNGTIRRIKNGVVLLTEAFRFSYVSGVIAVNSADNENAEKISYPDSYWDDWCIKVGGIDNRKHRYVGTGVQSAYGHNLDLVAPGFQANMVNSTIDGGDFDDYGNPSNVVGNSFTAPLVSGTAGLMLSYLNDDSGNANPSNLATEDVEWILQQTAEDLEYDNDNETVPAGYDKWTGHGLLRSDKALLYLQEPNFLIQHYSTKTTNETRIASDQFIKILDDYFPGEDASVQGSGFELCKNKKYKADVYWVVASIEADWPGDDYSIVTSSMYSDINDPGYWLLNSRSNLWEWDASSKDINPYYKANFIIPPFKDGNKMKATVGGYIYKIQRKKWSFNDINKWYPHTENEDHKLSFSVYYTKQWPLGVQPDPVNDVFVYPNPGGDFLKIKLDNSAELEKVCMYSLLGQEVLDEKVNGVNGEDVMLDISSLETGFYIVSLIYADGQTHFEKYEIFR